MEEFEMENKTNKIDISHYVECTKVLGPYLRSALWVHGCRANCDGCVAKEMNAEKGTIYDVDELAEILIRVPHTEGITISGGEPFLQAESLVSLITEIKKARDYGVIVYTGFLLEELQNSKDENIKKMLYNIDILIDGRYIKELDDNIPYRGSSNQRIIELTDRYKDIMDVYYNKHDKRNIEINVTGNKVYMIGVPSEYGLKVWEDFKKKAGGKSGI